jgi:hypothetical protein
MHGAYTVLIIGLKGDRRRELEEGCYFSNNSMEDLRKDIWKIRVPRAVALFLWKACTNILPTKENLNKRGIASDPLCPVCGLVPETMGHVLWSCPAAKDVWLENMMRIQKSTCDEDDFINIVEKL